MNESVTLSVMDQGKRDQVRNRGCTETAMVKVNAGGSDGAGVKFPSRK